MISMDKMKNNALNKLTDAGGIVFLVLFPHLVPLPLYSYSIVCLLMIWFLLRKKGRTFRDIGLAKRSFTRKAILIGIISAVVWVGFMQFVYIPLIKNLFVVPDYTEYNFIRGSIQRLIMYISMAWLVGGFYEEIVFRGFIQSIFEKTFFKNSSIALSITATSLLFGLYHWQQDIYGIVAATLGGFFWGFLFKNFDNNLWIVILSHAVFDSITLVLIYTETLGNLL